VVGSNAKNFVVTKKLDEEGSENIYKIEREICEDLEDL